MKKNQIVCSLLFLFILVGCTKDNFNSNLINTLPASSALDAVTIISQDNSGKVVITPTGEGVASFEVIYGDETTTPIVSQKVSLGSSLTHFYSDGKYKLKVTGIAADGKKTELIKDLDVTYLAPKNLVVKVEKAVSDNLSVTVSATADLATKFQVYFGDVANETPTDLLLTDKSIKHTYAIGNYKIKVVALSAGAATTVFNQDVVIYDKNVLPIDFESAIIDYTFTNVGDAPATVVNNTNSGGLDTSSKVGKVTKSSSSALDASSSIDLTNFINFTTLKKLKMKVWSPKVGTVVKFRVENLVGSAFKEAVATTTVANDWQELTFDMTGALTSKKFQRIILFFDYNIAGTGTDFFFDDIKQSN